MNGCLTFTPRNQLINGLDNMVSSVGLAIYHLPPKTPNYLETGTSSASLRSPSLGECNQPLFPSQRFHRPIYFYAPSKSIQIVLNPQLFFFPDLKIFPSKCTVFKSNSPIYTHPMVSGFTQVPTAADSLRIFSTPKSGCKNIRIRCRIRRMRVDGSRIRKEKAADSKISDTFGWGLSLNLPRIQIPAGTSVTN